MRQTRHWMTCKDCRGRSTAGFSDWFSFAARFPQWPLGGAADAGSCDRPHAPHQDAAVGGAESVARCPDIRWKLQQGKESRRRVVRMARSMYDFHVSSGQKQTSGSGDAEQAESAVRLAEVLACRALGTHQDLGRLGAGSTPSSNAGSNTACTGGYSTRLEVASHGSDAGARLFPRASKSV